MRIRSRLTKEERKALLEIAKITDSWVFVAGQLKANTALVPGGQKIAKQFEAIAELMKNTKETLLAQKLTQLGYPQGVGFNINLTTGRISRAKHQTPPIPNPKK